MPIALITLLSLSIFVSAESLTLKLNPGWNLVALGAEANAKGIVFELSEPSFTKTISVGGKNIVFKITQFEESGSPYLSIDGSESKTNYYAENDKLFEETGAKIIGSRVIEHQKKIEYTLSDSASCDSSQIHEFLYASDKKKYLGEEDQNVDSYLNSKQAEGYRFSTPWGAKWVYTKKACSLGFEIPRQGEINNYRKMSAGWNFIGIVPEMIGQSLNEIKGNCELERAFLWDVKNQQWGTILNLINDKEIISKEGGVGRGMVLKVSSECQLADLSESNQVNPPQIPN